MKKLLLASTALVFSAGVAAADVALSGDARMGLGYNSSAPENKILFISRARVTFTMSGETDAGMAFGASFRADNATGAAAGTAGSVFISGDFGRLTMGDTAGAAQFAVGHVAGVGLTGLGDFNESLFLGNNTDFNVRPTARYDYSMDGFTFAVSHTQIGLGGMPVQTAAIGASYATDMFTIAAGYEMMDIDGGDNINHAIIGVRGSFEGISLAANYGRVNKAAGTEKRDQYSVSASGEFDATTVTAYYARNFGGATSFGVGASYDLGGGASLDGGIVRTNTNLTPYLEKVGSRRTIADFGLNFRF